MPVPSVHTNLWIERYGTPPTQAGRLALSVCGRRFAIALALHLMWSTIALAEPATAAKPATASGSAGQDLIRVTFDQLASFPYLTTSEAEAGGEDASAKRQIPAAIQALDNKRIAVTGYLLPLAVADGLTTQAILLRSQLSCCYGVAPAFNEFVIVTVAGRGVRPVMEVPVTLVGTLHVGETYEDGYLVGIYRLEGERLIEPNHD